ncbi:hypothetical protein LEP1GSC036_1063 [Leptospira weilii str. 2006001853]|uniref:Uncharacterized protein n=1 Tax=Leptospira weilii str. 2006001853 TaxID=1001589 RepID=A0A828YYJ8_9LEPT|nr:hypothetical protein LEP1GSC036_1063 [Leptospira weilii str. 2006001853]
MLPQNVTICLIRKCERFLNRKRLLDIFPDRIQVKKKLFEFSILSTIKIYF